jgi:hypothetical protein
MNIDNNVLDELYLAVIENRSTFLEESKEWYFCTGIISLIEDLHSLDKELVPRNNGDSMKEYALSIIDDLEEDGNDLTEGCWMLQWKYDERPDIAVTLIVGEFVDIEESDPGSLN